MVEPFKFEFSLEVLNHLGRGLIREFPTVIAEAVSNAWDAEATKVMIDFDKNNNILIIEDNGKGMDRDDFQDKFLKVGYPRRIDGDNRSKRIVLGRKGIGKLASLSIAYRIIVISRRKGGELIGGVIDDRELEEYIRRDEEYKLGGIDNLSRDESQIGPSGTKIIFKDLKVSLNREDTIRKYLAAHFNFIFSLEEGDKFQIFVNGKEVTQDDLRDLNERTQFLWLLGSNKSDHFEKRFTKLERRVVIEDNKFEFKGKNVEISGFIASVDKPSALRLRGSGGAFQAGISLFANGRFRQDNLFSDIRLNRFTESYLYGEVHVDYFDDNDSVDRFTSSREGVIKEDELYQKFIEKLRAFQTQIVVNEWDKFRRELKQDGDPDSPALPLHERRLEESKNRRTEDFKERINKNKNISQADKQRLSEEIRELSHKNTEIYQDLYILENLFREHFKIHGIDENYSSADEQENVILREIWKEYRMIKYNRKISEEGHALKGKIVKEEKFSNYLDYRNMSALMDIVFGNKTGRHEPTTMEEHSKEILPVRNAVMHTNEVTSEVAAWRKIRNLIELVDELKPKKTD